MDGVYGAVPVDIAQEAAESPVMLQAVLSYALCTTLHSVRRHGPRQEHSWGMISIMSKHPSEKAAVVPAKPGARGLPRVAFKAAVSVVPIVGGRVAELMDLLQSTLQQPQYQFWAEIAERVASPVTTEPGNRLLFFIEEP